MLERFIDNPFLAKFYKNPKDFAFKLEMSFLADRYQQTNEDLSQLNFFSQNIISDYDIHKSLIFSKINLILLNRIGNASIKNSYDQKKIRNFLYGNLNNI